VADRPALQGLVRVREPNTDRPTGFTGIVTTSPAPADHSPSTEKRVSAGPGRLAPSSSTRRHSFPLNKDSSTRLAASWRGNQVSLVPLQWTCEDLDLCRASLLWWVWNCVGSLCDVSVSPFEVGNWRYC